MDASASLAHEDTANAGNLDSDQAFDVNSNPANQDSLGQNLGDYAGNGLPPVSSADGIAQNASSADQRESQVAAIPDSNASKSSKVP
jgi:hypothetical protein